MVDSKVKVEVLCHLFLHVEGECVTLRLTDLFTTPQTMALVHFPPIRCSVESSCATEAHSLAGRKQRGICLSREVVLCSLQTCKKQPTRCTVAYMPFSGYTCIVLETLNSLKARLAVSANSDVYIWN